jgi:hypothetical protein
VDCVVLKKGFGFAFPFFFSIARWLPSFPPWLRLQ